MNLGGVENQMGLVALSIDDLLVAWPSEFVILDVLFRLTCLLVVFE